ncbi:hypothetical protein SDJN03_08298, partial [Cucurbita argyrosperma subsp. sororia]
MFTLPFLPFSCSRELLPSFVLLCQLNPQVYAPSKTLDPVPSSLSLSIVPPLNLLRLAASRLSTVNLTYGICNSFWKLFAILHLRITLKSYCTCNGLDSPIGLIDYGIGKAISKVVHNHDRELIEIAAHRPDP